MSTESKPRHISTEMLAEALCVKPQTIRAGLCHNKGVHYMGLKPVRLPNRRLLWPADAVDRLTKTGGACPA